MTVTLWEPTIGNVVPPLPASQGGTGVTTGVPVVTAANPVTGTTGFALQNGTPTILTWTAPNDGNTHYFSLAFQVRVTVAETGGAVTVSFNAPDGTATSASADAGGRGTGIFSSNVVRSVAPGSTVSLAQSSALTAGTAVCWAELYAQ